jgi:large subunit ribosomal protein L31e
MVNPAGKKAAKKAAKKAEKKEKAKLAAKAGKKKKPKKDLTARKERRAKRALQEVTREYVINLHNKLHSLKPKARAPRAIQEIRKFVTKLMSTKDVRLDVAVNKAVWSGGIAEVPPKLRIVVAKRRNTEEGAKVRARLRRFGWGLCCKRRHGHAVLAMVALVGGWFSHCTAPARQRRCRPAAVGRQPPAAAALVGGRRSACSAIVRRAGAAIAAAENGPHAGRSWRPAAAMQT